MHTQEDAMWQITGLLDEPVELPAADWLSALGSALRAEGRMSALGGLACEQLNENVVIVHDMRHAARYVLQKQGKPAALSLSAEPPIPLHEAHGMPAPPLEELSLVAYEIEDVVLATPSFEARPLEEVVQPYSCELDDLDDFDDELTVVMDRALLR